MALDHRRLPAVPLLHPIQQSVRLGRQSLGELLGPDLFGAYGNARTSGSIRQRRSSWPVSINAGDPATLRTAHYGAK